MTKGTIIRKNWQWMSHITLLPEQTKLAALLSPAARQSFLSCPQRTLAKDEVLFQQGDNSQSFYVILSGIIRVQRHGETGSLLTFDLLQPNQSFGELAAYDNGPRTGTAIAATKAGLVVVPVALFRDWIATCPDFAYYILDRWAQIVRTTSERLARLAQISASERIVCALLDWEKITGDIGEAILPTQEEWASLIDVSRETLARYLSELDKNGIIKKHGRRIVILDRQRLRNLAAHESLIVPEAGFVVASPHDKAKD